MGAQLFLRPIFGLWCIVSGVFSVFGVLQSLHQLSELLSQGNAISWQGLFPVLHLCLSLAITTLFACGISAASSGTMKPRLMLSCFLVGPPFWGSLVWIFLHRS